MVLDEPNSIGIAWTLPTSWLTERRSAGARHLSPPVRWVMFVHAMPDLDDSSSEPTNEASGPTQPEPPAPAVDTERSLTTRRQFLGLAGAAGFSLLISGTLGCSPEEGAAGGTAATTSTIRPPEPSTTTSTSYPEYFETTQPPSSSTTVQPPPSTEKYPATETPSATIVADVCVVGGGAAGMCAATVAARMGARTVLMEESSVLGGNVTRGLVSFDRVAWGGERMVGGWFAELISRLEEQGDALFPTWDTRYVTPCDADALRATALALAEEAGVDIRLCSEVTGAELVNGRIASVWTHEQGSWAKVFANVFIDCTGDGNLGHMAGCDSWQGDADQGFIQGQTLIFCVSPVDFDRVAEYARTENSQVETYRIVGLRDFMRTLRKDGEVEGSPQEGLLIDRNMWPNMVSISGSETYGDHLKPGGLTEIVAQLQRQNSQIHRGLRERVPGFEGSRIVRVADRPYLREGRRIAGLYQLSATDIQEALKPKDSVARGYYPIDLHRNGNVGIVQSVYLHPGDWYGIPYRCLVAKDVDNLLMAGRCISVSHEALGSTRISPVSMALGQAAGIAAALCVSGVTRPAQVDLDELIAELQQQGALT